MVAYSLMLLLGSIVGFMLFKNIPNVAQARKEIKDFDELKLSIIIPARNEEKNIKFILDDLKNKLLIYMK